MSAAAVWTATKASKDAGTLRALTNPRDTSATAPNDTVGTQAAADALAHWSSHAQTPFDAADPAHLAAAVEATIAQLWRRNAPSSEAASRTWSIVWGDSGLVSKLRDTGPRGAQAPLLGYAHDDRDSQGRRPYDYGDRRALPHGLLPRRRYRDED